MIKKFFLTAVTALTLLAALNPTMSFADDPKPDPNGGNTGAAGDVPGFVVSAPAELNADDAKDTNKVASFQAAKKASDDYAAQAKLEPLAVKLADNVGHN